MVECNWPFGVNKIEQIWEDKRTRVGWEEEETGAKRVRILANWVCKVALPVLGTRDRLMFPDASPKSNL